MNFFSAMPDTDMADSSFTTEKVISYILNPVSPCPSMYIVHASVFIYYLFELITLFPKITFLHIPCKPCLLYKFKNTFNSGFRQIMTNPCSISKF